MIVTFLMFISFVHTLYLPKTYIDYKDLDKVMQRIGLENDSTNEPSSNEKLTHGY